MSGFLDAPAPRWFTIPAHRPFLEDLAAGIWRSLSPLGPEAMAGAVVLIPTRRAARTLAEAFLKASSARAVILPQIRALGDLDEGEAPFEPGDLALDLPPAITPARRRFELAGLAAAHDALLERRLDAGAALDLADALAAFLDACQIEERGDPADLDALVDVELARHWTLSADFLRIALEAWPRRLAALGLMDGAARRVALTRRLARRWRDHPPTDVIVAAGSTGSAPASADLLAAIASAPRGCVALPGLDMALADAAWSTVDEQHPQGAMKRLLARAGLDRGAVREWDPAAAAEPAGRWRRRLINEALRPPEATADWLDQIDALRAEADGVDPFGEGLAGLTLVTARAEEEAATVAALLLREALETPGKTAALVTPDDALARRVSARLRRWDITADSSAGQPLAAAPAAVLAARVAAAGAEPLDPAATLAILKHPLARLGFETGSEALERARRTLERRALRGPRPEAATDIGRRLVAARSRAGDDGGVLKGLDDAGRLHDAWLTVLAGLRGPFASGEATAAEAARALAGALEAVAAGPDGDPGTLWSGQAGEGLATLLAALIEESDALPAVTPRGFADLVAGLLTRERVRPGGASHPRLRILGVLEARLVRADRLILAGLEEGVWPRAAPVDPFLSRPMRARLGLPPPERRIGLSAHDFAQGACAPEVYLLNRERRDGAPAVASRWLWRLRTLIAGANLTVPARPEVLAWAQALDAPLADPPASLRPAPRPRPTPPVAARPRVLGVTAVERWVRDPYGLYAREVLRLRPLERPDEPVDARARGEAIHRAFEAFALAYPEALPEAAEARFEAMLLEALRRAGMPAARMARERALAANIAPWVIAFERRRRPGARLLIERQGRLAFPAPAGPFTLTAKADRIEARGGVADILDLKTGTPPSRKTVAAGLAPQLTLTGAILSRGGFEDLGRLDLGDLVYVKLSGGRKPGEELCLDGGDAGALAADALEGLRRRVAWFDDPSTPYVSWAAPQFIGHFGGDYDHLARLWEWHVMGDAAPESGE
jgi:ATP-dependent helicase/nuclease subunit B